MIASCLIFFMLLVDALAVGFVTDNMRVPIRPQDSTENKESINPFSILGEKGFNTRNFYGRTRSRRSA